MNGISLLEKEVGRKLSVFGGKWLPVQFLIKNLILLAPRPHPSSSRPLREEWELFKLPSHVVLLWQPNVTNTAT